MLHLLLATAAAEKTVALIAQEAQVTSVNVTEAGIQLDGRVRDACSWHIQNFIWYDGIGEADVPCSEWRPLAATDPDRRLRVETSNDLPLRGPKRGEDTRSLRLEFQAPLVLSGSEVDLHIIDGRLETSVVDLGAALVLADFGGVDVSRVALGLQGDLVGSEGVPVRFVDPPRTVPVEVLQLSFDLDTRAAEAWRCEALQQASPAEYQALSEDRNALAGYAAATCEEAAAIQAPPLCDAASDDLADADGEEGAAIREAIEPILGFCGPGYRNAAREHAQAEYTRALGRGDLDDGLRVVEVWADEMGAEWAAEASTQLNELVAKQIPSRFDWALHNGATDQARELFETYSERLGPEWSADAEARLVAKGG